MAFAGLNVTFGFIQGQAGQPGISPAPIYGPASSSENMAVPGTSAVAATSSGAYAYPMASVYAAADSWVTVGATPADPALASPVGGKRFIPAQTLNDFFVNPGDKIRWSLA